MATKTGNNNNNRLVGTTGNDVLKGLGGIDFLWGGAGNDELEGGDDRDVLHGGPGNDELYGGDGHDVLYGGTGRDRLNGEGGNDVLVGEGWLDGGDGNDTILAGPYSHIWGGPGADVLMTTGGGVVRYRGSSDGGGTGVTVNLATGTGQGADAEGDVISGFWGIIGSDYDDTLTGDEKDNWLRGKDGGDTLDGGGGEDWAAYTGSREGVQVDLGGPKVNGFVSGTGGRAEGDKLKNIERLWGSEHGDTLRGDGVRNQLLGEGGDDVLEGRGGPDAITGGSGSDTASYQHSPGGVTVDLTRTGAQAGTAATNYDAAGDGFHSIENLRGSAHADTLTGDGNANVLEGGAGADTLNGGDGSDTASYEHSAGNEVTGVGVTVDLTQTGAQAGTAATNYDAAGDRLTSIENLRGSKYADTLTGNGVANVLEGGAGRDTLTGGGGADTLIGGAGGDTLDGGLGNEDTASYVHSPGGVTVNLSATPDAAGYVAGTGGDAQGDKLKNIEHLEGSRLHRDTLTGNSAANRLEGRGGEDYLYGKGGNDVLDGGAGDDTLEGDAGEDTLVGSFGSDLLKGGSEDDVLEGGADIDFLIGGAGADTFVFKQESVADSDSPAALDAETDVVTDFTQSEGDKLDFRGLKAHGSFTGTKLLFRGTGAFTTSADQGQVRYSHEAGKLTDADTTNDRRTQVTVDVDGDGDADFQVTLQGATDYTLTVSDILGVEIA